MSANPDTFTGAFAEFAIVEPDFGDASETESVIGATMGETTLTNEATNTEFNLHELQNVQRKEQKDAWSVEFTAAAVADFDPLETIGIIDADGNYLGAQDVQLRIYFYDSAAKTTVKGVVECPNTNLNTTEQTYPVDSSEISLRGFINTRPKFGKTTA